MSQKQKKTLAPFVSLIFLVLVALVYIFFKMETVREGYELVRLGRYQKLAADERSLLGANYAKLIRPERIEHVATKKLALGRAQKNQVILMAATGQIAIRQ